eukprot:5037686-Amphidinium_carterae.1
MPAWISQKTSLHVIWRWDCILWVDVRQGVSSWGPQQLEGEVRQGSWGCTTRNVEGEEGNVSAVGVAGAWGWIRAAHVQPKET